MLVPVQSGQDGEDVLNLHPRVAPVVHEAVHLPAVLRVLPAVVLVHLPAAPVVPLGLVHQVPVALVHLAALAHPVAPAPAPPPLAYAPVILGPQVMSVGHVVV